MAQVKIYGIKKHLAPLREKVSDAIHASLMEAFGLPEEKRFHRFIMLDKEDFFYPSDRSPNYTILEIHAFVGRSEPAKRNLVSGLYKNLIGRLGYDVNDLEIVIIDTPAVNWGIRGRQGCDLNLDYKINL